MSDILPKHYRVIDLYGVQELEEARQELSFIVALMRRGGEMDLDENEYMGLFLALCRIMTRLNTALAAVEHPAA